MLEASSQWLSSHSWTASEWSGGRAAEAVRAAGLSVAVVLPALNEAATVGPIVASIRAALQIGQRGSLGIVDELVVVDSGSTDGTAAIAVAAGARVVRREEVLPELPPVPGKGEAMWRGLAATRSDIVVFIDADLQSFTPDYVTALIGPLAADPSLSLVKALYERPLVAGEQVVPAGGGRVTELVARPLLNRFWPELAAVVQPLAGEYAGRRSLLQTLPFPCGYGVELALMVDTYARHGLAALGQVDLGVRVHRHHDEHGLGVMAAEILDTALRRVPGVPPSTTGTLTQFERVDTEFRPRVRPLATMERPPLANVLRG
ncbi:MAG: glucosyl-3-phosphoglycerate synthase [Candidatus Nanopelagicales bacterium]